MTFALSGNTITQSGTDTSLAGLAGIAGVTRLPTGDGFLYYMPSLILLINGTLTIADPAKDTFISYQTLVGPTGNYTSGTFASDGVTPLTGGSHFVAVNSLAAAHTDYTSATFGVASGGRYTFIGGTYSCGGGVYYTSGAIVREYRVKAYAMKAWGTSSQRFRSYTTDVIKRNCEEYDMAFDLFVMPQEFSVKAFGSEYVAQYVGANGGGVDAKFVASALSNADGTSDFDNWGAGWCELYNCASGANLRVISQGLRANHCVPLFQDIDFAVTDLAGVAQPNVRLRCIDAPVSNSPTTTITTAGGLKTWDFRGAQSYTSTTIANGSARLSLALQVWHGTGNLKNLRFPNSTATVRLIGYAVRQQDVQVLLGSDTAISKGVAMIKATGITLTETQAGALTGITFTANGPNSGTVNNTVSHTASEIWQAWRYWKGLVANADSNDTWEFGEGVLNTGAWNVSNTGVITGSIVTTGTVTSAASAVTGTVIDSTGTKSKLTVTNIVSGMVVKVLNTSTGATVASGTSTGTSLTLDYTLAPGVTSLTTTLYTGKATGQAGGYNVYTTSVTLGQTLQSVAALNTPDGFYGRSSGRADRANVSVSWNTTTGVPTITLSAAADATSVYDVVLESWATGANLTYYRPTTTDGLTYQYGAANFSGAGRLTGSKQFFTTGTVSVAYDLILNSSNTLNVPANSFAKVIKTSDGSVIRAYSAVAGTALTLDLPVGTDYKVYLKAPGFNGLVSVLNSGTGQVLTLSPLAHGYYNAATDISAITPLISMVNTAGVLNVSFKPMNLSPTQVCAVVEHIQKQEAFADVSLANNSAYILWIDGQYQITPTSAKVKFLRDATLTTTGSVYMQTFFSTGASYPDFNFTPKQAGNDLFVQSYAAATGTTTLSAAQEAAILAGVWSYATRTLTEGGSGGGGATLAEIEASTVLAMKADLTPLAKESTVATLL